jgi:predicted aspartyl protease
MDLTGDLLMMEVGLWSRRTDSFKYAFITVDTGASVTTISKEILHQLGCEPMSGDKKRIVTASGIEYVDRFNIGKIKLGNIECNSLNLNLLNAYILSKLKEGREPSNLR